MFVLRFVGNGDQKKYTKIPAIFQCNISRLIRSKNPQKLSWERAQQRRVSTLREGVFRPSSYLLQALLRTSSRKPSLGLPPHGALWWNTIGGNKWAPADLITQIHANLVYQAYISFWRCFGTPGTQKENCSAYRHATLSCPFMASSHANLISFRSCSGCWPFIPWTFWEPRSPISKY